MISPTLWSSASDEWATPRAFYAALDAEFGFTLDVCATTANAKCERFYTREQDGLTQPWTGVVWCNPPYGREVGRWLARAREVSRDGLATVVLLVHARTDTRWWHEHAVHADETRFVRGRLVFNDGPHRARAPFPSVVLVFRRREAP